MTSTEQSTEPSVPLLQREAGEEFVVTITHTVGLRVRSALEVGTALGMSPSEALVEIAGRAVVGDESWRGLALGQPVEVLRVDRVDTDIDRVERFEFTDGREWRMHVPARVEGEEPIGRPTTFVVTDGPLAESEALAIRDLIRDAALSGSFPASPRGHKR